MNKLYWIVCEEAEQTLYEGRYLGRTRGAAMKHLKEQLGRSSLSGLVFSITEIPVPLIKEIVREILAGEGTIPPVEEIRPAPPQQPEAANEPVRFEAFSGDEDAIAEDEPTSGTGTAVRTDYDWDAIKAVYMEGRGPKDIAESMNVPINTLRKRITRDGWARERRGE